MTGCRIHTSTIYFSLSLFFNIQAILHFVNQNMSSLGLQVTDMDKQVKTKMLE